MEQSAARDVIVVGAGLGGLAAARTLADRGYSVLVLEKSRSLTGRAASKHFDNGAVLDFGVPFFTVRNAALRDWVQPLERRGLVQVWQYGVPHWSEGSIEQTSEGYPRYVVPGGINTLGSILVDDEPKLEVKRNALVSAVWSNHFGYRVVLENGDIYTARAVLVGTPAPQALALTRSSLENRTYHALERVKFAPCWALLLGLTDAPKLEWRGMKLNHPVFSWASLEHSKQRHAPALLLHANAAWSTNHLEDNSHHVADLLLEEAQTLFGSWLRPNQIVAHRWRYAQAIQPHPEAFLAQEGLVFCGDWCAPSGKARLESAFESGLAAAAYLGKHLEHPLRSILADEALHNTDLVN